VVFELDNDLTFPNPNSADESGLLAIGGDLKTKRLIEAYKNGIFPWPHKDYPLLWFSPPKRALLFPNSLKISNSLKKSIKKYEVRFDTDFGNVIRSCANAKRKENGTWIDEDIINAYINLFKIGVAHSVETYFEDNLVGGLYGISVGNIFCGESMFSNKNDASKVALHALCELYKKVDGIIDAQIQNRHLKSLGVIEISRDKYLEILNNAKFKQDPFLL